MIDLDYYALISRGISSAHDNSVESRQSIYERARTAVIDRLRQVDPPLSPDLIETAKRDIEAAIQKIEAEYQVHAPLSDTQALIVVESDPTEPTPALAVDDLALHSELSETAEQTGPTLIPTQEGAPKKLKGRVDSFKPEKNNGWIKLTGGDLDGIKDFFFNANDFSDKMTPTRGEPVEFNAKTDTRPPRALNISRLRKRFRGKVRTWLGGKGFGFIECDEFADGVFVHYKSIQDEGPRELTPGEEIEFATTKSDKGIAAKDLKLFQSRFALERFANIDKLRAGPLLEQLAGPGMAQHEDWTYKQKNSRYAHPVLFNYIIYTFAQLLDEGKVVTATNSDGRDIACGNTGLVTDQQEEIFALFVENRDRTIKQKWTLEEFVKASNRKLNNIKQQPDIANYFDDPTKLIYNPKIELRADFDHILEDNLDRFPENLRENTFQLRQNFDGALDGAIKRVRRNYKTAVPQFYQKRLQLLLPLCMSRPNEADLALIVSREGEVYIGSTVLPLDAAYNNARLIARPDREWL